MTRDLESQLILPQDDKRRVLPIIDACRKLTDESRFLGSSSGQTFLIGRPRHTLSYVAAKYDLIFSEIGEKSCTWVLHMSYPPRIRAFDTERRICVDDPSSTRTVDVLTSHRCVQHAHTAHALHSAALRSSFNLTVESVRLKAKGDSVFWKVNRLPCHPNHDLRACPL